MAVILPGNQLNVAALTADDLYIAILNPPGYITAVPTDVFGIVGTGSYGPVNKAVHVGSPQDILTNLGGISAASLTDAHDIATDAAVAFGQAASQASLEGWYVRVTDATDVAASGSVTGAATAASVTATVGGTIQAGDTIQLIATSSALTGSPISLPLYTVAAGNTTTTIAAALVALVNANAVLVAAGVYAQSAGAVVTLYAPSTLSPAVVWSRTIGGSSPVITLTLATAQPAGTLGVLLTFLYTGSLANTAVLTVATGAASNTSSVFITFPNGISELYPNLPNTGFWVALANAINFGLSGFRGPSGLVRATNVNIAVGVPTAGNYTFSGGTDGRAGVGTAQLLGADNNPGTGLYALRQQNPQIGVAWLVGCTDSSAWAASLAFAQTEACSFLATFAAGTSTSVALSSVQSYGIHDPAFAYVKDWIYFFDSVNGVNRLVPPTAFIGGRICTLAPQLSPGNKPVNLVGGTERNNQYTGNQPYTVSEVGQLASAGVMFVTNPIPSGTQWGIRHGQTTSLSPVTQPFEWWRMSAYLARSLARTMGQFVDQNQSQQPNDPTRNAVANQLNGFLNFLKSPTSGAGDGYGQIDDFTVVCTFSSSGTAGLGVNTPVSISMHYLFALVRVRYLSSIRFFVLSIQGGTTVVTVGATPGQQLLTLPQAA